MEKFIVKEKERVVICILTVNEDDWTETSNKFIGVAKCHESDTFDANFGKEIARRKAMIKMKKQDLREFKDDIELYEHQIKKWVDKLIKAKRKAGRCIEKIEEIEKELKDFSNSED